MPTVTSGLAMPPVQVCGADWGSRTRSRQQQKLRMTISFDVDRRRAHPEKDFAGARVFQAIFQARMPRSS
jgi:hypothetical protein